MSVSWVEGAERSALDVARLGRSDEAARLALESGRSLTLDAVEEVSAGLAMERSSEDDRRRRLRLVADAPALDEYRRFLDALAPDLSPGSAREQLEGLFGRGERRPMVRLVGAPLVSARLAAGDTVAAVELALRVGAGPVSSQLIVDVLSSQRRWAALVEWLESGLDAGGPLTPSEVEACLDGPARDMPASDARWLRARASYAAGDFGRTVEICRRLEGTDRGTGAALLAGRALMSGGDLEAGRRHLRELDRVRSNGADAILALARGEKAAGRVSEAIAAYGDLSRRWPAWRSRGLWAASWLHMSRGDYGQALQGIDELLSDGGGGKLRPQAMLQGVLLAGDRGSVEEAVTRARSLDRGYPDDVLGAAGRFWGAHFAGEPVGAEDLGGTVYAHWINPELPVAVAAPVDLSMPPGLAELLAPTTDRPGSQTAGESLDRAEQLLDRGLDRWARAEIRYAEARGAGRGSHALRLARLAWVAGAVDVYLRLLEPWTEDPRWLHPLRYLGPVVDALDVEVGLDPLLVLALLDVESRGNPEAVSSAGAVGLMQLLPATASRHTTAPVDRVTLEHPLRNIEIGCRHLESLFVKFDGREERVLAAYNAGSAAVERWDRVWPDRNASRFVDGIEWAETRNYVRTILAHRAELRRLLRADAVGRSAL